MQSRLEGAQLEVARGELKALRESGFFDPDANTWKLLEYVCLKQFDGEGDRIKEYTIAVELFGRPDSFDKKRDSIVRVEAYRLRKRLCQFYEGPGAARPLRIVIPPGHYAPLFEDAHAVAPVNGDTIPMDGGAGRLLARSGNLETVGRAQVRTAQRTRRLILAAAVVLAITTALVWVAWPRAPRGGDAAPAGASAAVVPTMSGPVSSGAIRILAGLEKGDYMDAIGRRWGQESYATGGSAASVVFRPIARARDASLYLKRREGDFSYQIPLKPGTYEMRLFFAETNFGEGNLDGGGETSRLFRVTANGRVLLDLFDVAADAPGANTADIKVFKGISPGPDGYLKLEFLSQRDRAFVNAIEIVPSDGTRLRPIRMVARETGFIDARGEQWMPDTYVSGGRLVTRRQEVAGTPDPGLFQGERFGNFNYAIPVANATRYDVSLYFAETWYGPNGPEGGGEGSRLFDLYSEGTVLMQNFDLFREAGRGYTAVVRTFKGLQPNPQGKLVLSFVPRRNYACVNAIEVVEAR